MMSSDKVVLTNEVAELPPYTASQPTAEVIVKGGAQNGSQPKDPSLSTIYISVFAMLFCCWPCGLIGLIYGIQGMQQHYRGERDDSQKSDKIAKRWIIASIVTGAVTLFLVIFAVIASQAITYGLIFSKDYRT